MVKGLQITDKEFKNFKKKQKEKKLFYVMELLILSIQVT